MMRADRLDHMQAPLALRPAKTSKWTIEQRCSSEGMLVTDQRTVYEWKSSLNISVSACSPLSLKSRNRLAKVMKPDQGRYPP